MNESIENLEEACQRIEHLGLTRPAAKQILAALQPRLVAQQTAAFVAAHVQCEHCGKSRGIKAYHTRTCRTLFGTVTPPVPAWFIVAANAARRPPSGR
jgi:hypothetical protein